MNWAVTHHDWSCDHEASLRRAFEITEGLDKPVEKDSLETFMSLLHAHRAPVSNENLQRIIKEHDKNHECVINVNEFFKGLKYLQKAFVISYTLLSQLKRKRVARKERVPNLPRHCPYVQCHLS